MSQVYQDAQGRRERLVKHHLLLPHEIIGSLYDYGKIEMVTGSVAGLKMGRRFMKVPLLSLSSSRSPSRSQSLCPCLSLSTYLSISIYLYLSISLSLSLSSFTCLQ